MYQKLKRNEASKHLPQTRILAPNAVYQRSQVQFCASGRLLHLAPRIAGRCDVNSSQFCLAIALKAFLVLIALPHICSKCVFELHSISALLHPNDLVFRRALPAMV